LLLVDALRIQAIIFVRQRLWPAAERALAEAISLSQAIPYPYAEAKALYIYGQLNAALGQKEYASDKYKAALAICDRLGEGLYRPRIEHALTEITIGASEV